VAWRKLAENAESVKKSHLKDLLQDASRCASLVAEYDGIILDYSRQNLLPVTMVKRMLIGQCSGFNVLLNF